MADKDSLIEKIHNSIKTYYLTDEINITNENQVGYQTLVKMINGKMDAVLNNTLPSNITELWNDLKKYFNGFNVVEEFHLQFPSYSFSIELKDRKVEYVKITSLIRLKLSLVYPGFTVFYEEASSYENFSSFRPIVFKILSSKNSNMDPENDYFNSITALVRRHFSDYEYINHQIILLNTLSSVHPYNYRKENHIDQYSLYNFLFDDEYNSGNLEVTF